MKLKNLKKYIKRVMALALCAGCLAAVCSQSIPAAGTTAIQLEYTDNKWAPASGDTRYSGGILSGGTINVQMNLGQYSLISGTNALRATSLSNNVSDSDYKFTIDTNEGAGIYTVTVELLNGKEEAELQVSGNTSTITPKENKDKRQIYDGRVFTQGSTGSSAADAGLDITESQVVLTEESRLTIVCDRGQAPNSSTPSFHVSDAKGALTGIFKEYEDATVSVSSSTSSNRALDANRKVSFYLIPKDPTSGLKTLSITFNVPASPISDILDPNDSSKRMTAQGVSYDPNDKNDPNYGYLIDNNFLRAGTSYVMTFSPPSSTLLGLAVATKDHVARQILRNIQTNAQDSYIQWVGDDTEDLIANDSFGLKTADHRYNADFYITYQWVPNDPADQDVITIDQADGSDSGVATVTRKVDDVRGQLRVGIRLRGEDKYLIGTGDPTTEPEPTLEGVKVFDIVIRGSGEKARTLVMSSTTGATPDETTGEIGADIVETEKYKHQDPKDPTKILPGEKLPKPTETSKDYDMDVFAGRVPNYKAPPTHPYQYQIDLKMGRKNAAAAFVVVTADQLDVVELRLRQGSGEQLYMPRLSTQVFEERRGYRLNDIPAANRINNISTNSNVEQTIQMLVTAKNAGEVKLTFQYFVLIGNSYYVDSTHTATFKVVDTSPSSDSTLSNLIIQAATDDRKIYDFGFKPNVTDYTGNVLELPYICENYQIQPLVNDKKCRHLPVFVTARDIEGKDVTADLFPAEMLGKDENGKTAAIVNHEGTLPMTITQASQVYSLTFHFVAQNPNAHSDYRVDVMRVPPSTDDRLATLTFYDERDKTQTTQLLKDFDPDVTTYVMDVPYGAKRLKVGAVQSFPQALVEFDPLLQTLNYDPNKPEEPKWVPREYLDLRALEASEKYGVMPGYGNLPYFEIKVMPESEHKDLFDKDGNRELVGARFTRTYRIYIHRLPPSENSRLAAQSGIVVINSAEISNNPRALPFSPAYNAFTTGYFMTGRQALPFSTREVRFRITPADPTATVYIYNISEVGEPVVTPTPKPTEEPGGPEPSESTEPSNQPSTEPSDTPTGTPTGGPDPTASGQPTPDPTASGQPTPDPTASGQPTPDPTASGQPTPDPTASGQPTPDPTASGQPTGSPEVQSVNTGTLAGTGLAPFLGIGRNSEPDPTRPTKEFPMILETFNEYTSPIALEARRENGSFGTNELHILVVSEAGSVKDFKELIADAEAATHDPDLAKFYTLYKLEIERLPASTDADLLNVVVRDINGKEQKLFNFHKDETSYTFTVPYEAERVSFTPTLSYPAGATIQLKDSGNPVHTVAGSVFTNLLDNLASGVESRLYSLNDWRGEPRTFTLIVKSEAFNDSSESNQEKWDRGLAKEYTFTIRRGAPSTDARLRRLEVSGITEDGLSPVFKASQLEYTATVQPGGSSQVTITPTVNEPHATIMWWEQGDERSAQRVQSGTATDPIELVEEHTVICVQVTAQDGETRQTYKIDFYNPNVVDLTDNADLASLKVERGVMTPEFDPAVITYEVAVKEDTWSVSIIPKPADPLATVQVFEGTREMGDYNNNYALALKNGANVVTVRVTSPDGTRTKDYTVTIYRNDEEHEKTLKPLTAEDLGEEIFKDPSVNPIIISVVEYPRIQSDVFQALKDATAEDPNKTLVLQGNDFSLTFRGADLDTIIPTREIYDFSMSFSSPDEARINELVGGYTANVDVLGEVVMVYFDYHGDLPGTATLHINVGNKYASQPLFWHYYNRERDRIDYYGTVQSNSQGTFAVLIDHFSTYLVTRYHMIAGAEDRSGSVSLNVNSLGAGGKINPQTGAGQHRPGDKP